MAGGPGTGNYRHVDAGAEVSGSCACFDLSLVVTAHGGAGGERIAGKQHRGRDGERIDTGSFGAGTLDSLRESEALPVS